MKKILTKIYSLGTALMVTITMGTSLMAPIAFAQPAPAPSTNPGPTVDQLFNTGSYTTGNGGSKIGIVSNLKNGSTSDWQTLISAAIKLLLSIAGVLAFIAFTAAGIMMVSARGNEDQIKKGKDILIWSILALAVIATSYAIVLGITQLQFSQ